VTAGFGPAPDLAAFQQQSSHRPWLEPEGSRTRRRHLFPFPVLTAQRPQPAGGGAKAFWIAESKNKP